MNSLKRAVKDTICQDHQNDSQGTSSNQNRSNAAEDVPRSIPCGRVQTACGDCQGTSINRSRYYAAKKVPTPYTGWSRPDRLRRLGRTVSGGSPEQERRTDVSE